MASTKQYLYPIIILSIGVAVAMAIMGLKKPPELKEVKVTLPVVLVEKVSIDDLQLDVRSQGVVNARYETRLVAQVGGEIVQLSDAFVRGGFVKKGQQLAQIDPSDYETALIDAQANHAAAIAALEIEQAAGHVAKEEWKNVSSTAPSDLGLRRPQLKQEQAKVKAALAAVKRAKRNLERTQILAPYDALIESRKIGLGSYVGTGTELGKIFNTSVAEVRLPIPTNELQYLTNHGVGAKVDLLANFAGQSVTWTATIARSEGVIDEQSRMSYLVAQINKPYDDNFHPEALRFGTYVTAKVYGIEVAQAAVIPRHLIRRGKVAILDDENKLRFKLVTIKREQDQVAVVTAGLEQGEQIITSGLDYPVDGMDLALKTEQTPIGDDATSQVAMKEE